MSRVIPYGKQTITEEDIQAVVNTLKSDYLTQGPAIEEFENKFAKYINAEYAIAVANGTVALHLCAMALDVDRDTNVITSPITFAASANCIRYCNGSVYFADIDPYTLLLDIKKVKELIESKPKGFFKGIIPVDFAGYPVDMEEFRELANEHGLWIIEDACHSPGGYFIDKNGDIQNCGNGRYTDLSIFSFHPVKHIATGEGGMITTNNRRLYEKIKIYRTHGITRDADKFINSVDFATGGIATAYYPNWYMEMQELGYNYRLSDLQAALGTSQLKRAADNLCLRQQIAFRYDTAFKSIASIHSPQLELNKSLTISHAYHLYVIQVEDRLGLYNYLRENNIFCQIHYIPVHLMPYYRSLGWKEGDMPVAEQYYKNCISLPMYPTLSVVEQEYVIEKIIRYLEA